MLQLLTFSDAMQRFAAASRAATTKALDFTIGSILRAVAEGQAAVVVWLQWLILDVLRQTRGATSIGVELDTWVGDFGVTRLPAVTSIGALTFSRYASGLAALVPVGATALTTDRTQGFTVVEDLSNAAYSAASGGYLIDAGTLSVTVAAQSLTGGSAGNVEPGTVSVLTTAIPGVDLVTNALAFTGGVNAENDNALRIRFALFIQGLSKGTAAAVAYAVASVQQGLTFHLDQNVDTLGTYYPGNFVVTVDDGSGTPTTELLNRVAFAVDAVRTVGETFSVRGPVIVSVFVSMTITAAPGYAKAALQGLVAAAVTSYIRSLQPGQPLLYGQVYRTAYDAVPGIGTVIGLTLNGSQADVVVSSAQVIKPSVVAVN